MKEITFFAIQMVAVLFSAFIFWNAGREFEINRRAVKLPPTFIIEGDSVTLPVGMTLDQLTNTILSVMDSKGLK